MADLIIFSTFNISVIFNNVLAHYSKSLDHVQTISSISSHPIISPSSIHTIHIQDLSLNMSPKIIYMLIHMLAHFISLIILCIFSY